MRTRAEGDMLFFSLCGNTLVSLVTFHLPSYEIQHFVIDLYLGLKEQLLLVALLVQLVFQPSIGFVERSEVVVLFLSAILFDLSL